MANISLRTQHTLYFLFFLILFELKLYFGQSVHVKITLLISDIADCLCVCVCVCEVGGKEKEA